MSGTKGKFLPFLQVLLLAFSSVKAVSPLSSCCILDDRFGEFCPTTCGVATYFGKRQATVDQQLGAIENRLHRIENETTVTTNKIEHIEESNNLIKKQLPDVYINRIREIQGEVLRFEKSTGDRDQELRQLKTLVLMNNEKITYLKSITQQLQARCRDSCQDTVRINEITGPDCQGVADNGAQESGLYYIKPLKARQPFLVYCEIDGNRRGWTVLQRRLDGSVDFSRNWIPYKEGFGYLSPGDTTEFWLGNEKIHLITTQTDRPYLLQVDLVDWSGERRFAQYIAFKVASEEDKYRLSYGYYIGGNAGNSFDGFDFGDDPSDKMYTAHNYAQFSTADSDNDKYEHNCAQQDQTGWWMNRCHAANLNGRYHRGGAYTADQSASPFDDGIIWATWHNRWYSLKEVKMKIIPKWRYDSLQTEQVEEQRGDF
ncbi:fibrinogen gamma chain [Mustelus asterias]